MDDHEELLKSPKIHLRRYLPILIILGLAVYLLLPQITTLENSWSAVQHMNWWTVVLATVSQALSYLGSGFMLRERGIRQSMSRKVIVTTNLRSRTFFSVRKTEFDNNQSLTSDENFKNELAKYIEYCNHRRIKDKLKGLSPVQFRTQSNVST